MNALEDATVLIHIKLANFKVGKLNGRKVITFVLAFFILFSAIPIYTGVFVRKDFVGVLESAVYVALFVYITLVWLRTWIPANRMLKKAQDYEDRCWLEVKAGKKK